MIPYGSIVDLAVLSAESPSIGAELYKVPSSSSYYFKNADGTVVYLNVSSSPIPSGAIALATASVTLTAAQVKAAFTTPILIIPAPEAGYFIDLISATELYTYGGQAFDSGTQMMLKIDTASQLISNDAGNVIDQSSSRIVKMNVQYDNSAQFVAQKGLYVTANQVSVAGNGTVKIWAYFAITAV